MSETMKPTRIIPCLDVSGGRVVKGTRFEGLRDVGDPVGMAIGYERAGADEIAFLDISATTDGRPAILDIVRRAAENLSIPFTVGGGVRNETDAQALLDAGADKITVNSAALENPDLISKLADLFGTQCVVLAVDAKRDGYGDWGVYAAGGRQATDKRAGGWVEEGVAKGAGEVLLTSIDRDGTNAGYDTELLRRVSGAVDVPVIASGGAGRPEHFLGAVDAGGADALLAASPFHYGGISIGGLKSYLLANGIAIRPGTTSSFTDEEAVAGKPLVAIVDYGVGNRRSVALALERAGSRAILTAAGEDLEAADGIILPGVGAFDAVMGKIREDNLDADIERAALSGKPLLGICLGEQILFDESEEGARRGLGLIAGKVTQNPKRNVGWTQMDLLQENPLLDGIGPEDFFYFAHRYAAVPEDPDSIIGVTDLAGAQVVSMVGSGNIWGIQGHPEKSGPAGAKFFKNFPSICRSNQ